MSDCEFVKDVLKDILGDYLSNGKKNKSKYVLLYAAENISKNLKNHYEGKSQIEWEFITHHDENGRLLKLISDSIKNGFDGSLRSIENSLEFKTKMLCYIAENIILYFVNEFDDKAAQLEVDNLQCGNFDNQPEI